MKNLFANSTDYESIKQYNEKWDELVYNSHSNFDRSHLRVNPQRKKMVMEYPDVVGDKIYWRSVEMYINPERLSMSNSKIKQKAYTRGGIFYHHWGSDHWALQLTGYTGLATMDALLEIEKLYEVSGKILSDTKDSLLIHKTESIDPIYPIGNLETLINAGGSADDASKLASSYGSGATIPGYTTGSDSVTVRSQQIASEYSLNRRQITDTMSNDSFYMGELDILNSKSNNDVLMQYALARVNYEQREKDLEKIKISNSSPVSYKTNNKICENLTLVYKNIADSANLSAKINSIYEDLNDYVSKKEQKGEYVDFSSMYMKAQGLAKEKLSGSSPSLQSEIAYDTARMLNSGYSNYMYDLAYVPGTNAMSTYVVSDNNLPEGVNSFRNIERSSTRTTSSNYSQTLSGDVSNYTINELPTNTSMDKIWDQGVKSAGQLNKEILMANQLFHGSNFDASTDSIKNELYSDATLSWLWEEVKDINRPRYIFIYFDGRVFVGHFDSFSWGRVAQHPLINYELRFTVCHQIILKSIGDDKAPDEDRLIGILPKPPEKPKPVPAPEPKPPTPAPKPPEQPKPKTEEGVVVNCHALNVRKGPGMSHSAIAWLNRSDKVEILGKEGQWYKIKTPSGKIGYSHENYISKGGVDINATSDSTKSGTVYNCSQLNIRNKPSNSGKIIGAFRAGDKVAILGEQSGWYKVKMGNTTGYSSKKYIKV